MYPFKKKSALVKKEMQMLKTLVTESIDERKMLDVSMTRALQRVVVKRPIHAEFLADEKTHHHIKTKKSSFRHLPCLIL